METTKKLTIEIDISGGIAPTLDGVTQKVRESAAPFNIDVHLINPFSMGGGNPTYSFTGEENDLRSYVRKFFTAGLKGAQIDEEVNFHLGNIHKG